jgi:hypothetical protein
LFEKAREIGIATALPINKPAGMYSFRCVNVEQQFVYSFRLTIQAKKQVSRSITLRKGSLWLLSFPVDSDFRELSSGGRTLGQLQGKPRMAVALFQGRYKLKVFKRGTTRQKTVSFTIQPGKRTIAKVIWK